MDRFVTQYSQFTAAENDRLRGLLRDHLAQHGLSGAQAARAMGVATNTVTTFLQAKNGAGTTLVRGMERLLGRTLDELLGRAPPRGVRLDTLPDWPVAVARARELFAGELPAEIYAAVGAWVLPEPIDLEPVALHLLAKAYAMGRKPSSPTLAAVVPPPSNRPKGR